MNIFVQVVRAAHGKAMTLSKSPEATLAHRVHVALGRWSTELVDIARVASDPAALSKARFLSVDEVQGHQPWEEAEDDRAAELLFTFVVHLLASRIVHCCCLSETFPWKAAALLSEQPEDLSEALAEMSVWWEKLESLDEEAKGSLEVAEFREELVWPLWSWPRQVMLELRQCSFKKVPPPQGKS